jgi:translation elongation factor EF-1alpha
MLLVLLFISGSASQAQLKYKVKQLKPDQVPVEVTGSFAEMYPGKLLVKWEKHTAKGNKIKGSKYVARFFEDKLPVRARFSVDGTPRTSTTYYLGKKIKKLPKTVKAYAKENYPKFKLRNGRKIVSLKSNKHLYVIKLKKAATVMHVFLNKKGEELTRGKITEELLQAAEAIESEG